MYFDNVPNLLQYVQAGTLRAIALTSDGRSEQFPNLPTVHESGLDGFVATYWNGVLAPAGTPLSVVNRLNARRTKKRIAAGVWNLPHRGSAEMGSRRQIGQHQGRLTRSSDRGRTQAG